MAKNDIDVRLRLLNARRFERDAHSAGKAVDGIGTSVKRSATGAAASAAKFAGVAAGIGGIGLAFKKIGSETIGFDKSMRNVNSLAQLSEGRFKGLEGQVLKLAGKTAQAPVTLADGLYDLVSSGFDAKQSLQILGSTAKAATAGLTTTEVSTKAVAAVLNAYRRPASDAANISDTLFQTVNKGVISFEQLSSSIGDVLPFASSLGVGLDQVGASISTLTKGGISPEETMTRLKNVMVTMLKPGDALRGVFKKLGVTSGEALIKQKGFQGALEAIVGTTDGTKSAVAALFPNIRSLGGVLALTGKNARGANKDLAGFKDVTGATDKALKEQQKSLAFQWQKIKAVLSSLAIQLGSKLIPAVTATINKIAEVVGWFRKHKTITKVLATVVGVAVAGLVVYKATVMTVAAAQAVAAFATGGWTGAFWALNAAMTANPIGLIVVGLVALAAGFVYAYTKVGWFRKGVQAVFGWVKKNWPLLLAILTGPIGIAVLLIVRNFRRIRGAASSVVAFVRSNWPLLLAILTGPIGIAVLLIVKNFKKIRGAAASVVGAIRSKFNLLIGFFQKMPGRIGGVFSGLFNGLKSGFRSAVNFIINGWNAIEFSIGPIKLPGLPDIPKLSVGTPNIPLLAQGGTVMGSGSRWVSGERGPELGQVIPGGVKVTPIKMPASVTGAAPAPRPSPDQPAEPLRWHQTTIPVMVDGKAMAKVTLKHFGNQLARA